MKNQDLTELVVFLRRLLCNWMSMSDCDDLSSACIVTCFCRGVAGAVCGRLLAASAVIAPIAGSVSIELTLATSSFLRTTLFV